MKLIIGLGNPEPKYINTRHNTGYIFVDAFNNYHDTKQVGMKFIEKDYLLLVSSCKISGEETLIIKPTTGMNTSGEQVKDVVELFDLKPEEIIVVVDEVDLEVGKLKVAQITEKSTIRHNGIKSVKENISAGFVVVKVGIGKNKAVPIIDWVLSDFTNNEFPEVDRTIHKAIQVVDCIISNGVDNAMNLYNK